MRKILLLLCILSITITAKAQLFGKNWKEGSYYDLRGTKHVGFINIQLHNATHLAAPMPLVTEQHRVIMK